MLFYSHIKWKKKRKMEALLTLATVLCTDTQPGFPLCSGSGNTGIPALVCPSSPQQLPLINLILDQLQPNMKRRNSPPLPPLNILLSDFESTSQSYTIAWQRTSWVLCAVSIETVSMWFSVSPQERGKEGKEQSDTCPCSGSDTSVSHSLSMSSGSASEVRASLIRVWFSKQLYCLREEPTHWESWWMTRQVILKLEGILIEICAMGILLAALCGLLCRGCLCVVFHARVWIYFPTHCQNCCSTLKEQFGRMKKHIRWGEKGTLCIN